MLSHLAVGQVAERPCATGVQNYSGYGANARAFFGTKLTNTYRTFHYVVGDHRNLRFSYAGWIAAKGFGDQPISNSYYLEAKAQILFPDGRLSFIPLKFDRQSIGTVAPGATLVSDPLKGDFPHGTIIWLRQRPFVTDPAHLWPSQGRWHWGLGEGVASGNQMTAPNSAFIFRDLRFGPVMIAGEPVFRQYATPAIIGDSYESAGGGAVDEYGIVRRCLSDNIAGVWMPGDANRTQVYAEGLSDAAFVRLERAGYGYQHHTGERFQRRKSLAMKADYLVFSAGFNNLVDGGFPAMRTALLNHASDYAGTGKTIVLRTVGMRTTSIDDVTTASGQTPSEYEEARVAFNEYLIDPLGAAPEVAAITGGRVLVWDAFADLEVNAQNEVQRGGGRWRVFGEHGPYICAGDSTATSIRLTGTSLINMGHRETRGPGTGFRLERNQFMDLSGKIQYASGLLKGQIQTFRIYTNEVGVNLNLRTTLPQVPARGDKVWIVLTSAGSGDLNVIHPSELGLRHIYRKGRELLLSIPVEQ